MHIISKSVLMQFTKNYQN